MMTMKNLVKMMLMSILTAGMMTLTACSSNDDVTDDSSYVPDPSGRRSKGVTPDRTVLVYLAGYNNLSEDLEMNVGQLKEGSKYVNNGTLLVFVRSHNSGKTPWLGRIVNGQVKDSLSVKDLGISVEGNYASSPEMMGRVLQYAYSHYPAKEYGLVLGGHSTGWIIEEEPAKNSTRAFGHDTGDYIHGKPKWINVPTMRQLLEQVPHLKFIMADCCNFMCLESLYELRNVCDYIIGSPAEIPSYGAPYKQIVTDFFAQDSFYSSIVDKYYKYTEGNLPLTAVKTSEMDRVAQATREALRATKANIGEGYADMTGIIHYNYTAMTAMFKQEYCMFYDAGNFFLKHAPQDAYQQWKQALDQAVVTRRVATSWATDLPWRVIYSDFTVTNEKMHGVSMFVEQDPATGLYSRYNEDIKQLKWWDVVNK